MIIGEQLRCYVCGRIDEEQVHDGVLRRPLNWSKDSEGNDRCPQHGETDRTIITLGELVASKARPNEGP